jgi:hypothetical protein
MKSMVLRKSGLSRFLRGCAFAAASVLLILPSAGWAAEGEEEETVKDQEMKDAYLKAVPYPGGLEDESDLIKMHSVRLWYLLTYPTGQMPSSPWTKAKKHNDKKLKDAAVWEGDGLVPASGSVSGSDNGLRLITDEAVIAPGTNTWVSYGPKALDFS